MRFTDQSIRALPFTEDGQKEYRDDLVRGLSVLVGKRTKTFMVTVRAGNRRHRQSIGQYDPPQYTLAMGRERARDLLAQARLAKTQAPRISFNEAFRTYDRVHVSQLRPQSQRQIRRNIETHFMPSLGKRALTDIKATDIAPLLDGMLDTPTERHNSFVYLGMFLNWCMRRGYIDVAPTSRMDTPKKPPSRERVLTADELVAVWRAADPETDYGRIVRLCILSGQRIGQWANIRREYIGQDTITWPADAMKGKRTHTLPLTENMRALLPEKLTLLFPTSNIRGFSNWSRSKERLDKDAGFCNFTHHDLRRTWATISAEEIGTDPHVIEAVLAHAIGSRIMRTYNRAAYLKPMREALEAFEKWLASHIEPQTRFSTATQPGTLPPA